MDQLDHELRSYLLDDRARARENVRAPDDVTPGAIGLLRRLYQATQGDPTGAPEQLAVGAGVLGLTAPDAAQSATVTVEVGPVRARFDGRPATVGVGLLLPVGSVLTLTGRDTLHAASFVGTVAGSVIDVAYWT